MFCANCGKELSDNAYMCPQCGEPTTKKSTTIVNEIPSDASEKEWLPTLLLCIFLGGLGIHSFYSGKTLFGVLQLLTLGGCGIWTLIDLILIITKSYRDGEGKLIVR